MLIDELKEQLKLVETDVATIKSFWENSHLDETYLKLKAQSEEENFWQNPQQTSILKDQKTHKEYGIPSRASQDAKKIYQLLGLKWSDTPFVIK